MSAILLDTHAWAWSLTDDPRLSRAARAAMRAASIVYLSPISFFEIAQKARIGKWPEMEPMIARLSALLIEQGGRPAPLDSEICATAGRLVWAHRDPFDRLICATARREKMSLVSADVVFDGMNDRIW